MPDMRGPIGTVIDGIAGAIGGWWGGRSAAEVAEEFGPEDDDFYRRRYETSPHHLADRTYANVRPAYQIGHLARNNPDYRGLDFDSIEHELRAGWADQVSSRYGDWEQVREYARDAYAHGLPLPTRELAIRERAEKGDDGHADARLQLPVSRR
jgi:hypothetical protein